MGRPKEWPNSWGWQASLGALLHIVALNPLCDEVSWDSIYGLVLNEEVHKEVCLILEYPKKHSNTCSCMSRKQIELNAVIVAMGVA